MVSDTRKPPRGDTAAPQEGSKPAPFGLLFGGLFLVAFFLAEYLRLKLKIESVGQHIEKLFHGSLCNGTQILLFYALDDGCALFCRHIQRRKAHLQIALDFHVKGKIVVARAQHEAKHQARCSDVHLVEILFIE